MWESWIIGCVLTFAGSFLINFGTNLMKLGHIHKSALKADSAVYHQPLWLAGFFVFAVGNCLNFFALGLAAQSLLAALGSCQFIFNVFWSYFLLNEAVSWRIFFASAVVILGNIFMVVFGPRTTKEFSVDNLKRLYQSEGYIIYICVAVFFIACSFVGLRILSLAIQRRNIKASILSNVKTCLFGEQFLPQLYAIPCALIGCHTVMLSKSCIFVLRAWTTGDSSNDFFAYFLVLSLACNMLFWLNRMSEGLRRFPSFVIVPSFQIIWTSGAIIEGGVYFHEFSTLTTAGTLLTLFGFSTMIFGMYLLAPVSTSSAKSFRRPFVKGTIVYGYNPLVVSPSTSLSPTDCFLPKLDVPLSQIEVGLKDSLPSLSDDTNFNFETEVSSDNFLINAELL
eukprot:GCRY01002987.1.p1 GENE.GCRY01002987.1~~GCRY01002987.1.p1  ORF type:complete len:394 (+),score=11.25 GCRY01002987.1:182-1363(+)